MNEPRPDPPRRPFRPWLWALGAGLAVLLVAFAPAVWQTLQHRSGGPGATPAAPAAPAAASGGLGAPWQIGLGPQGELRAFGLRLPGSTLADAVAIWGDELQVALIATRGQEPALEAYTERWVGGGVTGKLVLATDASPAAVARWQANAARREVIDADAQRWKLRAEDHAEALRSGVSGASFLPASRIDEATLRQRFGAPARELPGEGAVRHWLYPERGLAIAWDAGSGRAVVQVVAPAAFERRLLAPLLAVSPAASAPLSPGSAAPAAGPTR